MRGAAVTARTWRNSRGNPGFSRSSPFHDEEADKQVVYHLPEEMQTVYIYGKISFLTDDKNISANEDSTGTRFPTQLTGKDAVGGWEWEAGCEGELTRSRGGQFSIVSPNFK